MCPTYSYTLGAVGLYVYILEYTIQYLRKSSVEREPPFKCTVARGMWQRSKARSRCRFEYRAGLPGFHIETSLGQYHLKTLTAIVTARRHTGQGVCASRSPHGPHTHWWPQGMRMCDLSSSRHTTHASRSGS